MGNALKDIYEDPKTRSKVFFMIAWDNSLRYQLFKLEYPYVLLFLAFLFHYWQAILVVWLLLELSFRFYKMWSNSYIEIPGFTDGSKASDPSKKEVYDGLATLLSVKLSTMGRLYQSVNEGRTIGTVAMANMPLPVSIKAEDKSDLSTTVFSEPTKLSVGGFTISAAFINDLIRWIIQGPKINGSIYRKDDGTTILTARMLKDGKSLSWKTEEVKLSDISKVVAPEQKTLDKIVEELAIRIFTDQAFGAGRIVPWKATMHFTEGLISYRDCLHGTKDSKSNLLEARDHFEKALAIDEDFPWLHYNLGIVYNELGEKFSAEAAFRKAVSLHQDHWQPYYALAWNQFSAGKYGDAIMLCEKALYLNPGDIGSAKIHDLMASAWIRKNDEKSSNSNCPAKKELAKEEYYYYNAKEHLLKSVLFSLMGLFGIDLQKDFSNENKDVATKCLGDLALFVYNEEYNKKGKSRIFLASWLLDEALMLSPNVRSLHAAQARICPEKNEKVIQNVRQAVDPSSPDYWACLIKVGSHTKIPYDYKIKEKAKRVLLNQFSRASAEEIKNLIDALPQQDEDIKCLGELLDIKSCLEGLGCNKDKSSEIVKKWKESHEVLKLRDGEKIESVISNLRGVIIKEFGLDWIEDIEKDLVLDLGWIRGKENELECNPKVKDQLEKKLKDNPRKIKEMENKLKEHFKDSSEHIQNKIKTPCEALKFATMLHTLGSLYFLWFKIEIQNKSDQNVKVYALARYARVWFKIIFIIITEIIMETKDNDKKKYKDIIPNEYEEIKESLQNEWNIPRGLKPRKDLERYRELANLYPLTSIHRKNIARCYCNLTMFDQCRKELERAHLLDPHDPIILLNLGYSYLDEALRIKGRPEEGSKDPSKEKSERIKKFENGRFYLTQASQLARDDVYKMRTYFYLGTLSSALRDYDNATSFFQMGLSLAQKECLEDEDCLELKLKLGSSYLRNMNFNKAEKEFNDVNKLFGQSDDEFLNDKVNERLGEGIKRGIIGVHSKLLLAFIYMEKGVKLKDASNLIGEAEVIICKMNGINGIDEVGDLKSLSEDKDTLDAFASVRKYRGWLYYKGREDLDLESKPDVKYIYGSKISSIFCPRIIIKRAELILQQLPVIHKTNDDKIIIRYVNIKNAEVEKFESQNISFEHIKISYMYISEAYIISEKLTRVIHRGCRVDCPIIENVSLYDVKIEDMRIDNSPSLIETKLDRAEEELKESISLNADPEAYMFLALVYEFANQVVKNVDKKASYQEKAIAACQHSLDLDFDGEYSEKLTLLLERLGIKNPTTTNEDTPKNEDTKWGQVPKP
jgi:tetratricopeptide (TPR) repeat protein